jgi:predicted enzyme related to lactoylglutathione lyase
MADPFDALRMPQTSANPDPAFSQQLRARLERALDLPKGATVSDLVIETPVFIPQHHAITPYLAVAGARAAIDWYGRAFGARVAREPVVMPDGRVGHSELEISGALIMLADEHPEIGVSAPVPGQASVTLYLEVADADESVSRATSAGAHLDRAVADYPYGRMGVVRDPFGHRWMVRSEPAVRDIADAPREHSRRPDTGLRPGDIGYASLWVGDAERAVRFFSRVLGWRFAPTAGRFQVEGQSLHHGIASAQPGSTLYLAYVVADIADAVHRVRGAGGEAGEMTTEPWGLACMCTDDQGVPFSVYQPAEGVAARPGAPRPSSGPGDLAYVTMEVLDSAKARSFYGNVLGWHFSPGSVPDGWQVEGPHPMVGLSGGHRVATLVPVYRADDVAAAVARVRQAGGTATDPEARPYGLISECSDDQGTRFGLWQP